VEVLVKAPFRLVIAVFVVTDVKVAKAAARFPLQVIEPEVVRFEKLPVAPERTPLTVILPLSISCPHVRYAKEPVFPVNAGADTVLLKFPVAPDKIPETVRLPLSISCPQVR
jgi:hypothetical protein